LRHQPFISHQESSHEPHRHRPAGAGELDDAGRATLFTKARTANTFAAEPVSDAGLSEIWELAKWEPTSASTQPLRVLYVRAHWLEGAGLPIAGQAVKDKNFSLSIKILG
jgi:3-hydroxypropanoate dehydrogenase